MKAAYAEAWPTFKSVQIWANVTPDFAAEIETEQGLYAVRPAKAEVVRQLLTEGMAFRRMHRPKSSGPMKPKRPKRVPFPIDI
jgi:hypothetical protein